MICFLEFFPLVLSCFLHTSVTLITLMGLTCVQSVRVYLNPPPLQPWARRSLFKVVGLFLMSQFQSSWCTGLMFYWVSVELGLWLGFWPVTCSRFGLFDSSVKWSVIRGLLARGLTSEVSEVDGLSVGVEQLDDGVIIILHSAADGGWFTFNHCHVVSRQVLALHYKTQREHSVGKRNIFHQDQRPDIDSLSNIIILQHANADVCL